MSPSYLTALIKDYPNFFSFSQFTMTEKATMATTLHIPKTSSRSRNPLLTLFWISTFKILKHCKRYHHSSPLPAIHHTLTEHTRKGLAPNHTLRLRDDSKYFHRAHSTSHDCTASRPQKTYQNEDSSVPRNRTRNQSDEGESISSSTCQKMAGSSIPQQYPPVFVQLPPVATLSGQSAGLLSHLFFLFCF